MLQQFFLGSKIWLEGMSSSSLGEGHFSNNSTPNMRPVCFFCFILRGSICPLVRDPPARLKTCPPGFLGGRPSVVPFRGGPTRDPRGGRSPRPRTRRPRRPRWTPPPSAAPSRSERGAGEAGEAGEAPKEAVEAVEAVGLIWEGGRGCSEGGWDGVLGLLWCQKSGGVVSVHPLKVVDFWQEDQFGQPRVGWTNSWVGGLGDWGCALGGGLGGGGVLRLGPES